MIREYYFEAILAKVAMPADYRCEKQTLRAKGTLISEPRFSTPCEMRLFPGDTGKKPFSRKKNIEKGHFPCIAWEKSLLAGGRKSGLTN